MLGMSLVIAIMALLLGGTLHGLASYRATMGTCDSKLRELGKAVLLKEEIAKLRLATPGFGKQQLRDLYSRIKFIESAFTEYEVTLKETVERGRAPDDGRLARGYTKALETDLQELKRALKDEESIPRTNPLDDLLDKNSKIGAKIFEMETHVSDLIGTITDALDQRVNKTRSDAQKSIWLLACTGVLAVLMMTGLLRFFHRWVAQPIRDLEQGVSRVARGDFQQRIEIHSGDEIEDLAKAYNEMTDKLRAMYDNLAQQVNERSRQLVRSERLAGVGFLAAGVAHEINNPLASIAFCSEALESRLAEVLQKAGLTTPDRETITKYLKMIQEEAFRCKEITQKLLAFSRGGERTREPTNLVDVIQGVLDMVQHLQNCKGKRIDFRPLGPMLAWVNAQEIKQVFLNLVVNALESMEEGGTLTITHALHNGVVELTFKDTGCGMTSDILENIFEPFYTRSRTGKGTGLGLSISHRIITQHGGEIEADSDGGGQGSTFKVRLPVQPAANDAPPGQDVQDPVEEFLKLSSAKGNSRAA